MPTTMRTARTINVAALAVHPASTGRSTREPVVVDVDELLDRPRDLDDLVAMLRFSIAWTIEGGDSVDDLADRAGVAVARLAAFLRAPAERAGDLLTAGEAGRLARAVDQRLEDRDLMDEYLSANAIANCYIEVEMADGVEGSYRRALRTAREVRRRHRARHPIAPRLGMD